MAAFATVEDLATYMERDFTAAEAATASQVLDLATADIKGETGQRIDRVADESITIDPPNDNPLILPEAPVTAITSVTVDGSVLIHITDYYWTRSGLVWRRRGRWGWEPSSVQVIYTHGIQSGDKEWDVIKRVCLAYTARMMDNPTGVSQESMGDISMTHAKTTGLKDEERRDLARALGRVLIG